MTIRSERPEDHGRVFAVLEQAFGRPGEAHLVEALRGSPTFIPSLSLVAEDAGTVVGHILFTRLTVRGLDQSPSLLALAPLAVAPDRQREGIGDRLVRHGLAAATQLGHEAVIVVGHPTYYPRFGFAPADAEALRLPFPVSPGAYMALELRPGALRSVRGDLEYAPEFFR
jgi:putative acetyltransferase